MHAIKELSSLDVLLVIIVAELSRNIKHVGLRAHKPQSLLAISEASVTGIPFAVRSASPVDDQP